MNSKVQYWRDISVYDLDTAKAMHETGRYLYVGFMCHQTIEKILKGFWQTTKGTMPPKTHNLLYLSTESGLSKTMNADQLDFIDELDPLNIEARYPESKEFLSTRFNRIDSEIILKKTQELQSWIQQKLS